DVLDFGQVSAFGHVNLVAGGNVEVPDSSRLQAGSTVTIVGHVRNTAPAGVTIDVLGAITATSAHVEAAGDNDVVNLARGQDTTPTNVTAHGRNDTVDVRNNGGPMTIISEFGPTTINVGSLARLHTFIGAATFSAAQRTITRSAGSFLADGFAA